MNSLRRRLFRIDVVVEFDSNRRFIERVIKRTRPFNLERFGLSRRHHFQIREGFVVFRIEQTVHDQVVGMSDRQRISWPHPKLFRFRRARRFFAVGQNDFNRKSLMRIAVLKINVLGRFRQSDRIS